MATWRSRRISTAGWSRWLRRYGCVSLKESSSAFRRALRLTSMGKGDGKTIVMVHGWPDTARLWHPQIEALQDRYECIAITLPGFEGEKRAYTLDEVVEAIRAAVGDRRVTLLLHDWGCLYGYQFAMRHPERVERVIGVDIGDAGSRAHLAEIGVRGKLMIVAYQHWLALAWCVG